MEYDLRFFNNFLKDQRGVYALTTAILLPGTLLFMGLAMGTLTLINDKSRLADASEAASLAVASQDPKSNDTEIALGVYESYFPYDITNLSDSIKVNYKSIKDPTQPNDTIVVSKPGQGRCIDWGPWASPQKCVTRVPYVISKTGHYWHFYRASIDGGLFHSFAAGLFGTLGFKKLVTVNNTGVAVVKATETTYYKKPNDVPLPLKPNPPPVNLESLSVSILLDTSESVELNNYLPGLKKLLISVAKQIRMKANGSNALFIKQHKIHHIDFQFIQFNTSFLDTKGRCYSSLKFDKDPSEIVQNIDKPSILLPSNEPICKYLITTPFINIDTDSGYKEWENKVNSISKPTAITGMAPALVYSFQQLYNINKNEKTNYHNLSIIITDGFPNKKSNLSAMDEGKFCDKENSLMMKKFESKFGFIIAFIPGVNGYLPTSNLDIFPNCYPAGSDSQLFVPSFLQWGQGTYGKGPLKQALIENYATKLVEKIVDQLQINTTTYVQNKEVASSENQNNGYDYNNNSVVPTTGPVTSTTSTPDGPAVLTYRGGKDTPALP